MGTIRPFEMRALQAAVEEQRQARGLTWAEAAAEINVPFLGTPSIPISVGTLREMASKRSVTSGVVLQVLRWLSRSPESFLRGGSPVAEWERPLPPPAPGQVLRLDTRAIYEALNEERVRRGLNWRQAAGELPGFTENMLRNLASGPLIGFPRVMVLTQWLGRPAASFARLCSR